MSPEEILRVAKQIGLSGLSITDHDTVEAYAAAIPLSQELGLQLLPGVEFSSAWERASVHILGYGFALDHPQILSLCQTHAKRRLERNQAILDKLSQHGMPLTYEEVLSAASPHSKSLKKSIGRPHIAMAMAQKGYVKSIQEAFTKYIAEESPCYVQGSLIDAAETIEIIHAAEGAAIIAHPHLIKNEALLQALLKLNFDGIECYYGSRNAKTNARWIRIAQAKKWLITGGSDFHGLNKPYEHLGSSWVDEKAYQNIKARTRHGFFL